MPLLLLEYIGERNAAGAAPDGDWAEVCVDLPGLSAAETLASLPFLEGVARTFPQARVRLFPPGDLTELLQEHVDQLALGDRRPMGLGSTLRFSSELGANEGALPCRPPEPASPASWARLGLAYGLRVLETRPRLRVQTPGTEAWPSAELLHQGPLLLVLPTDTGSDAWRKWGEEVAAECGGRIAARRPLPKLGASLLRDVLADAAMADVVLADESPAACVAAWAGFPVITISERGLATPSTRLSATKFAASLASHRCHRRRDPA